MKGGIFCTGLGQMSESDCAREAILPRKNGLVDQVHDMSYRKGDRNAMGVLQSIS